MNNQKGQSMVEYVLIVAFVAVVCIIVIKIFGNDIKKFVKANQTTEVSAPAKAGQVNVKK